MTGLLELRDKLKIIYSRNEVFILPILKFLVAFLALNIINTQMGYMNQLDNIVIVLITALLCSFLPPGFMIFFGAAYTLLHMYALSIEVAAVGLCLYLVMFLLFFRLSPKDSLVVVLTPILFLWKVPYILPIVMGLIGTPAAAVSISCGVIVYYFLDNVIVNATAINGMSTTGEIEIAEATAKLRLVIDGLLNNKTMLIMIAAFSITVVVVYLIRRMSIDYSWTIAILAGVIINLVILLVGDLLYDTNMPVLNAVIGSFAAIVVAKIVEFFRFCVDYSRTEKVQFEDDEYYYYVKAVPKMTVAAQTKTVKKINTQTKPNYQGNRTGTSRGNTSAADTERTTVSQNRMSSVGNSSIRRETAETIRTSRTSSRQPSSAADIERNRRVTAEHAVRKSSSQGYYNNHTNNRSVSLNSHRIEDNDDYEELD